MMNTHVQHLEPRADTPIVIETPIGLIRITREAKRPLKLKVELPEGLRAYVGEERALEHAKFIRKEEDGKIVARFSLLTPVYGPDGHLEGVAQPELLKVNP